jgi:hypothetical protein
VKLIDTDAAIEAVCEEVMDRFFVPPSVGYDVAEEALKKLPSIQPDTNCSEFPNNWIPCSDRMPEEHEWIGTKMFGTTISDEVYVTFEAPDGQRFADHISFQNGKLSRSDEHRMKVLYKGAKPIAWKPQPEPYQEGGKQ